MSILVTTTAILLAKSLTCLKEFNHISPTIKPSAAQESLVATTPTFPPSSPFCGLHRRRLILLWQIPLTSYSLKYNPAKKCSDLIQRTWSLRICDSTFPGLTVTDMTAFTCRTALTTCRLVFPDFPPSLTSLSSGNCCPQLCHWRRYQISSPPLKHVFFIKFLLNTRK